jgi:hypothetical protein
MFDIPAFLENLHIYMLAFLEGLHTYMLGGGGEMGKHLNT